MSAVVRCYNCNLPLWQNAADGVWYHECTAERECWGYPFYGNAFARPSARAVSVPTPGDTNG